MNSIHATIVSGCRLPTPRCWGPRGLQASSEIILACSYGPRLRQCGGRSALWPSQVATTWRLPMGRKLDERSGKDRFDFLLSTTFNSLPGLAAAVLGGWMVPATLAATWAGRQIGRNIDLQKWRPTDLLPLFCLPHRIAAIQLRRDLRTLLSQAAGHRSARGMTPEDGFGWLRRSHPESLISDCQACTPS